MMSAKMATPGFCKIKVFWKKGYDIIISTSDVTDKILSRDSNYVADVVMWQKHNLKFIRIWPEKPLF